MSNPFLKRCVPAFSIAEVVLSGFLLTTGIVSVMSLYTVSHRSSFDTRNMITAAELAQEGIEIARNIRDNNTAYREDNWTTGDNCSGSTAGNCDPFRHFPNGANSNCNVSYNSSGATAFDCSAPQTAVTTSNTGFLHTGAGTATRFFRLIKIDHTGTDSARVQSFAAWQNPGGNLNNAGAVNWCTPYNQCVYSELYLSRWK